MSRPFPIPPQKSTFLSPFVDCLPPIDRAKLENYLQTHCIPIDAIYANDFHTFMKVRQMQLLDLVVSVTKNATELTSEATEEGEEIPTAMAHDSGLELIETD